MERTAAQQAFEKLYQHIAVRDNYVPRNYQTIGGLWTNEIVG